MPDPFTFPPNAKLLSERLDPADLKAAREPPPPYENRKRHVTYIIPRSDTRVTGLPQRPLSDPRRECREQGARKPAARSETIEPD